MRKCYAIAILLLLVPQSSCAIRNSAPQYSSPIEEDVSIYIQCPSIAHLINAYPDQIAT